MVGKFKLGIKILQNEELRFFKKVIMIKNEAEKYYDNNENLNDYQKIQNTEI